MRRKLQLTAAAAVIIGYALLSHYATANPNAKNLGAILSIGPVFLIGILLVWRWTSPLIAASIAGLVILLAYRFWPAIQAHFEWADLAQQCAAYALVAAAYGRSLFARVPNVPGMQSAEEIAYTRRANAVWSIFYLAITLAILGLYFAAPLRIWSLFVNFGVFGLIALMCFALHVARRRALPNGHNAGFGAALRQALIG